MMFEVRSFFFSSGVVNGSLMMMLVRHTGSYMYFFSANNGSISQDHRTPGVQSIQCLKKSILRRLLFATAIWPTSSGQPAVARVSSFL